jgi:hypothetical protein
VTIAHLPPDVEVIRETVGLSTVYTARRVGNPHQIPRTVLRITLPDRTVTADIATKSLRRAQKTITDTGAENIAVIIQGALAAGDKISEAGLSAQPKAPKPPKAMA